MSFALERGRRATAGKRMEALIGKAQEEDDAFWGHDTWNDDGNDSENNSFRESDEDSDARQDTFDSDFNDSESDHDEEEIAVGEQEERELAKSERQQNQQRKNLSSSYVDSMAKSRGVGKKGAGRGGAFPGRGKRRIMGDGINAGIVLNIPFPGGAVPAPIQQQRAPAATAAFSLPPPAHEATKASAAAAAAAPVLRKGQSRKTKLEPSFQTLASRRPRRTQMNKYHSRFRASRSSSSTHDGVISKISAAEAATSKNKSAAASAAAASRKKLKRRQYSQEELLVEACNGTEPANNRWLLARKRTHDEYVRNEKQAAAAAAAMSSGKIIEKYVSRRGYLNTITFPEMDHVPDILVAGQQQRHQQQESSKKRTGRKSKKQQQVYHDSKVCVITGKPARYRDPRTLSGYYDKAAFKELRRRLEANEPLHKSEHERWQKQQREKAREKLPPPTIKSAATIAPSNTAATTERNVKSHDRAATAATAAVVEKQQQPPPKIKSALPYSKTTATKKGSENHSKSAIAAAIAIVKQQQQQQQQLATEKRKLENGLPLPCTSAGSNTATAAATSRTASSMAVPGTAHPTSVQERKIPATKSNHNRKSLAIKITVPSTLAKTPSTPTQKNTSSNPQLNHMSTRRSPRQRKPSLKLLENMNKEAPTQPRTANIAIHRASTTNCSETTTKIAVAVNGNKQTTPSMAQLSLLLSQASPTTVRGACNSGDADSKKNAVAPPVTTLQAKTAGKTSGTLDFQPQQSPTLQQSK